MEGRFSYWLPPNWTWKLEYLLRLASVGLQSLLRQARHPLKLQHQPQRGHSIIDVAAAGGLTQPIGDMTPGALLTGDPSADGRAGRECRLAFAASR